MTIQEIDKRLSCMGFVTSELKNLLLELKASKKEIDEYESRERDKYSLTEVAPTECEHLREVLQLGRNFLSAYFIYRAGDPSEIDIHEMIIAGGKFHIALQAIDAKSREEDEDAGRQPYTPSRERPKSAINWNGTGTTA